MSVIEFLEKMLLLFKGGFCEVENEGEGYKLKSIDFIFLAVVVDIFKEVFFVAEFGVVLKVVERLPENTIINAIFILEAFVGLLPSDIYEGLFGVLSLDPACPCEEDSFDKLAIITKADVEFEGLLWWFIGVVFLNGH